jgi:hypothetical protein
MQSFEDAKAERLALEAAAKSAGGQLKAIQGVGSGPMGLTPDAVKFSPEYRRAYAHYHRAANALRRFNAIFVKRFAIELRQERRQRGR